MTPDGKTAAQADALEAIGWLCGGSRYVDVIRRDSAGALIVSALSTDDPEGPRTLLISMIGVVRCYGG